eukprot:5108370-Karenia_brevis.AAC.1
MTPCTSSETSLSESTHFKSARPRAIAAAWSSLPRGAKAIECTLKLSLPNSRTRPLPRLEPNPLLRH